MTLAKAVILLLTIASAVLPLWGLFNLYRGARNALNTVSSGRPNAEPGEWFVVPGLTYGLQSMKNRPRETLRDLFLIGSGILAGAVGNIWALFLT